MVWAPTGPLPSTALTQPHLADGTVLWPGHGPETQAQSGWSTEAKQLIPAGPAGGREGACPPTGRKQEV